jgi:hypothetical protein
MSETEMKWKWKFFLENNKHIYIYTPLVVVSRACSLYALNWQPLLQIMQI